MAGPLIQMVAFSRLVVKIKFISTSQILLDMLITYSFQGPHLSPCPSEPLPRLQGHYLTANENGFLPAFYGKWLNLRH